MIQYRLPGNLYNRTKDFPFIIFARQLKQNKTRSAFQLSALVKSTPFKRNSVLITPIIFSPLHPPRCTASIPAARISLSPFLSSELVRRRAIPGERDFVVVVVVVVRSRRVDEMCSVNTSRKAPKSLTAAPSSRYDIVGEIARQRRDREGGETVYYRNFQSVPMRNLSCACLCVCV